MPRRCAGVVDLDVFLYAMFPSHNGLFTTDNAIRALAEYTGATHLETSMAVDLSQPHHTTERMQAYAAKIMEMKREVTREESRMTVMLPTGQEISEKKENLWKSGDGSSPLPVRPREEHNPKRICKQFRETGTCSYGARCLYHHSADVRRRSTERHKERASSVCRSLGIVDRCMEDLRNLKVSDRYADSHSKGMTREVLSALPSSTNNYCPSSLKAHNETSNGTIFVPRQWTNTVNMTVCQAHPAVGGVVMVPLSLPNGMVYGYAPLPLQVQPVQISQL